jgi:hypothetical protein
MPSKWELLSKAGYLEKPPECLSLVHNGKAKYVRFSVVLSNLFSGTFKDSFELI